MAAPPLPAAVGGAIGVPGAVLSTDPAEVGAWTPLIESDLHLAIHSVHLPSGKFLQFGGHGESDCEEQADCDKIVWYPPEPCSPFVVGNGNCEVEFDIAPTTPEIETHVEVPEQTELFCSAHVNIPPGTAAEFAEPLVLTAGGHFSGNNGINAARTFSESLPSSGVPVSGDWTWTELDDFSQRRWYPTTTVRPDARTAVLGGSTVQDVLCDPGDGFGLSCVCDPMDECDDPEVSPCAYSQIYAEDLCNPNCEILGVARCAAVTQYNDTVEILDRDPGGGFSWDRYENALMGRTTQYPFMFVLPDLPHFETYGWNLGGKLLYAGAEVAAVNALDAWIYDDTAMAPTISPIGGTSCTAGSSAVMLRPGKVMKFGGSSEPSRMTEILDLTDPTDEDPQWRRVGPTGVARRFSTGLLLPDGTALATGGTMRQNQGDTDLGDNNPTGIQGGGDERHHTVFTTELFDPDPASETWCRLADVPPDPASPIGLPTMRGYHSQSFLLPDGRVYLGASGRTGGGALDHFNYQLYSPPYLFWGERPVIEATSGFATTGTTLALTRTGTVPVSRVTLVKLSSATHNWDMEQRFVELENVEVSAGSITADMPPSTCYATPGPYMVFAISDQGVPSIGQYVQVNGSCDAALESSDPPIAEFQPRGVNTQGETKLVASCSSSSVPLELRDFGRSIDELCDALGGCPHSGTIDVAARLVASDSQAVPPAGLTLDTGVITFSGGHGTFTEPLRLDVKSGSWLSSVDLGSGDHDLELCATIAGVDACIVQPVGIRALAGSRANPFGYRLGTIESRFEPIGGLPFTRRLMLSDNGTETVALPGGFRFPFFGTQYSTLYIGANGGIRVTPGTVGAVNTSLPNAATNAPHIAPWWDDLDPSAGGQVLWRHAGKKIVVSWENVPHKLGPANDRLSFQVHLWDDGRVEMHYADPQVGNSALDFGASATVGIQRPGGTNALTSGTNNAAWLAAGARAAAYDLRGCIAADLRAVDSMPCDVVLDASSALNATTCEVGPINIPVPKLATTCRVEADAYVQGEVTNSTTRKAVVAGRAVLGAGSYTVRWWVHGDHPGARGERLFGPIAGPFTQALTLTKRCESMAVSQ